MTIQMKVIFSLGTQHACLIVHCNSNTNATLKANLTILSCQYYLKSFLTPWFFVTIKSFISIPVKELVPRFDIKGYTLHILLSVVSIITMMQP